MSGESGLNVAELSHLFPTTTMPPRRAATRAPVIKTEDVDDDVPTRSKRASRKVESDGEVDSVASDGSEEYEKKPSKKPTKKAPKAPAKRAPAKVATTSTKARKAAKALADDNDENEEEEKGDDDNILDSKLRVQPPKKPVKTAASRKSSRAPTTMDSDLDEPLDTTPLPRTPRPTQKRANEVALDEEENIVLETPSRRPPIILSPVKPEPEADKGPKPRLVIHKIVLVNFKSYAGRQEIGPFHKV
jgi:structural maintenance of chromosome 4